MTNQFPANADRHPVEGAGAGREDDERGALQRRLLLLPFCVAVFSLSALFYYHLRYDATSIESPLQVTYSTIYRTFGFAPAFLFFLLLLIWTSIWFFAGRIERPWTRLVRLLATTVMLGVFLNIGESGADASIAPAPHLGQLGAFLASRMVGAFGYYPSLVLVLLATLGALLLATDFLFSETFERLWVRSARHRPAGGAAADDVGVEAVVTDHLKGLAAVDEVAPRGDVEAAVDARPERDVGSGGPSPSGEEVAIEAREVVESEIAAVESESESESESELELAPEGEALPRPAAPRHRRSYFERRRESERAGGSADQDEAAAVRGVLADDESWLPSAPEAQEIENPEHFDGLDAAIGEADTGDEPVIVDGIEDDAGDEVARPGEEPLEADSEAAGSVAEQGSAFAIPRPDPDQRPDPVEEDEVPTAGQQQGLFPSAVDEGLIDEARQVVLETRRVSAAFLRRRLRIGYDEAREVLSALSARGMVELDEDAAQGRLLD